MAKRRIGEVQCELIMRGRDLDYINRFMLRFFGPSKANDGEYRTTTAWYMSDLRKKGFDIAKRGRKTKEQKMEKLLRLAEKYGIKVTVEAAEDERTEDGEVTVEAAEDERTEDGEVTETR